jgi:hypothetical protein
MSTTPNPRACLYDHITDSGMSTTPNPRPWLFDHITGKQSLTPKP